MTPQLEAMDNGKEFQVLDGAGCLTMEAMCFTEQLGLHHQAVVERHIQHCTICAQQLASMAAVANSFRKGKPRVAVPAEIKLLSRQLALRSAALKVTPERKATSQKVSRRQGTPRVRRPWYRSHAFKMALIGGAGTALALALLALLMSGCKSPPETPRISVKLASSDDLAAAGVKLSAAAAGPGKLLAAGTVKGKVLLLQSAGAPGARREVVWLVARTRPGGPDAGPPKERLLHRGGVSALAFSKDGKQLVSVGGKTAAVWDVGQRKLLKDVVGPQGITTVTAGRRPGVVYFATDQGHVLRWELEKRAPDALPKFACGASQLPSPRLNLPAEKRCPFGTYHVSKGIHACFYPATGLMLRDEVLVRACRSGNLGMLNLRTRTTTYHMSGFLRAMAAVDQRRLLLARDDGKLEIYDLQTRKATRSLKMTGKPLAAAATDRLLAVGAAEQVLIWSGGPRPALAIRTGTPPVWLGLSADVLQVMTEDGKLVAHKLTLGKL